MATFMQKLYGTTITGTEVTPMIRVNESGNPKKEGNILELVTDNSPHPDKRGKWRAFKVGGIHKDTRWYDHPTQGTIIEPFSHEWYIIEWFDTESECIEWGAFKYAIEYPAYTYDDIPDLHVCYDENLNPLFDGVFDEDLASEQIKQASVKGLTLTMKLAEDYKDRQMLEFLEKHIPSYKHLQKFHFHLGGESAYCGACTIVFTEKSLRVDGVDIFDIEGVYKAFYANLKKYMRLNNFKPLGNGYGMYIDGEVWRAFKLGTAPRHCELLYANNHGYVVVDQRTFQYSSDRQHFALLHQLRKVLTEWYTFCNA
jgi:hypothetical protein